MNSDNKKNCKAQNEAVDKAQADLDTAKAAVAEATKQQADEEKQHADAEAGFIMFVVSSAALGLVSKCRIPTAAVAQRGLFRILLGDPVLVSDVGNKAQGGSVATNTWYFGSTNLAAPNVDTHLGDEYGVANGSDGVVNNYTSNAKWTTTTDMDNIRGDSAATGLTY
jgi:hypothetical protein